MKTLSEIFPPLKVNICNPKIINFMKPCFRKKLDSISLNVSRVQFGDEHCAALNALAQSWTPKSATAKKSESN